MDIRKVIIIGSDPDLSATVHMCLSAYLMPIGIHFMQGDPPSPTAITIDPSLLYGKAKDDASYLASLPKTIPMMDKHALHLAIADGNVEIIAGAYGLRERDHFIRTLLYCKNNLQLMQPIRHPVYLLDRLSFDCNGFVCAGYPGSGNMLIQNILQHLTQNRNNANAHDPIRNIARTYAFCYWHSLSNYIESQLYDFGFWKSYTSPTHHKYGALYFDIEQTDGQSMLAGLPVRAHFWANPWASSHEPPTSANLDYFQQYGFKFIFIARNPLDIIVSLAGKATWAGKSRAAGWLLGNTRWFESALSSVVHHFQHAVQNKDRLIIAKYEDFLSSPTEAISTFAQAIGRHLEKHEAEQIWHMFSGASLSADSGHYWQPSEGKWMQYIPANYSDIIKNSGILKLAQAFGYDIDLTLLNHKQREQEIEKIPDNTLLALEENRFFICAGKPHAIFSNDIAIIHDKHLMVATHKKYKNAFTNILNSKILLWLLEATAYDSGGNFIASATQNPTKPSLIKVLAGK